MAMAGVATLCSASATAAVCTASSSRNASSSSGGRVYSSPMITFKRGATRGGALRKLGNARRIGGESLRFEPLLGGRASSSDETTPAEDPGKQFEELIADIKTKWDAVENKTTVAIYGGGALVTLWFSSTLIGAVNSVPLLPKLLELVGLGYTGWFVYRYLLFKSSRKELVSDLEELKGKIAGATNTITGTEEK